MKESDTHNKINNTEKDTGWDIIKIGRSHIIKRSIHKIWYRYENNHDR